jgi:hypothetical protein
MEKPRFSWLLGRGSTPPQKGQKHRIQLTRGNLVASENCGIQSTRLPAARRIWNICNRAYDYESRTQNEERNRYILLTANSGNTSKWPTDRGITGVVRAKHRQQQYPSLSSSEDLNEDYEATKFKLQTPLDPHEQKWLCDNCLIKNLFYCAAVREINFDHLLSYPWTLS